MDGARGRTDLDWIFTVQTERVVGKDNTVAIKDRDWQLEKSQFRSSLAGCTVTIHEHLDGNVSIRYGPHVVGRFTGDGEKRSSGATQKAKAEGRGKDGAVVTVENQKAVSHRAHRALEIPPRESHCPTAPAIAVSISPSRKPRSASRRGSTGQVG